MTVGVQPPRWKWTPTTSKSRQSAGVTLFAAVVHRQLHVLTPDAQGSAVSHARLGADDRLVPLADVPLSSLSSMAATADGVLAAGARAGDNLPVVCSVGAEGDLVSTIALPCPAPIAGWPLLVASDATRQVVWATGDLLDATVWLAELNAGRLLRPTAVLSGAGVLVMRANTSDGALDILCYGQESRFLRWRQGVVEVDRVLDAPGSSAASLLAGAVLTPAAAHAFRVWEPVNDSVRTLELPEPPERASARAQHPRLISAPGRPDMLAWQTHLPDDLSVRLDGEDAPRRVHGVSVRAWLASFDRNRWTVGPESETPSSPWPPVLEWLGDRLALVRADSGVVQVLLGT